MEESGHPSGGEGWIFLLSGLQRDAKSNAKFIQETFTPHCPPVLTTQGTRGASHSPSLMSLVLLESPLQEGFGVGGVFSVGSFC